MLYCIWTWRILLPCFFQFRTRASWQNDRNDDPSTLIRRLLHVRSAPLDVGGTCRIPRGRSGNVYVLHEVSNKVVQVHESQGEREHPRKVWSNFAPIPFFDTTLLRWLRPRTDRQTELPTLLFFRGAAGDFFNVRTQLLTRLGIQERYHGQIRGVRCPQNRGGGTLVQIFRVPPKFRKNLSLSN